MNVQTTKQSRGSSAAAQQSISTETGLAAAAVVAGIADNEKIDYALAGGIAMHLYGFTRATVDVDMIASELLELPAKTNLTFGGETYEVNLGQQTVEVDWIVRNDEKAFLYEAALAEAEKTAEGLAIVSPEWLVILKHFAARGKDEMDLLWLLRQEGLVDRQRLMETVKQMFGRFAFTVEQEMEQWFLQADLMKAKDERADRVR